MMVQTDGVLEHTLVNAIVTFWEISSPCSGWLDSSDPTRKPLESTSLRKQKNSLVLFKSDIDVQDKMVCSLYQNYVDEKNKALGLKHMYMGHSKNASTPPYDWYHIHSLTKATL